jgi:hypothetical protein
MAGNRTKSRHAFTLAALRRPANSLINTTARADVP